MRVLILGSSVQIGAYLTTYLRDQGHESQLSLTLEVHHGHDLTQIPNHNLEREVEKADFVFFLSV